MKIKELEHSLISVIEAAGLSAHAHMAILILVALSRDNLSIKEDLKLDGPLLLFARSILVHAIRRQASLESVQNMLLVLVAMPLSRSQIEFLDKKFKIIDQNLIEGALAERTWLSSKSLVK